MTRTEELLALAEAAKSPYADDWELKQALLKFNRAANPPTIKQLCLRLQKLEALVRLQHEALKDIPESWRAPFQDEALSAFNKFERGE